MDGKPQDTNPDALTGPLRQAVPEQVGVDARVTSTDVWGFWPASLDEDGHRVVPIGVARNR